MKLVILVNKYPPTKCGVGDYSFHLASAYVQKGYEVHVICRSDQKPLPASDASLFIWPLVDKWTSKGFSKALQKIKDIQPDWVLLQYVPYAFQKNGLPLGLPAIMRSIKSLHINLLIFFHEPFIRLIYSPLHLFFIGKLQRWIARQACSICDRIITSIDLYKQFLQPYTKKDVKVIPVGSNIIPVTIDEKQLKELRSKVAPNGEKIIVTFGERDHQLLVSVFKEILKQGSGYKLLICGNVKDAKIYQHINAHVYISGFLPALDIFRLLKVGDVFFLPDGLDEKGQGGASLKSGALAAALVAGLPVVGIQGDMNDEILKKADMVYLEPASGEPIANRIIQVVSLPSNNQKISSFWKEHLDWKRIIEQYNLYSKQ